MSLLTRLGVRKNGSLIGRRPGLNFIEGSNVSIAAADNPSSGRVDVTVSATGTLSAVPTFGDPDGYLAAGISAGAATLRLTGIPDGMFNSKGVLISVGTGSNTEVRRVASLASDTFTTNAAFKRSHSIGEPVRWLRDNRITPLMYGAKYNSTDDWYAWQRAVLDQSRAGGGAYVDGLSYRTRSTGSAIVPMCQPLMGVGSLDIRDFSLAQLDTPWVSETPVAGKTFVFPWVRNWCDFTATASDDKIHITTSDSFDSTSVIYFNDPENNNANLPGGITPGKRYYMQGVLGIGGNQFTFTLSTDAGGASPVNITSDGSGMFYFNPNSTNKVYIRRGFITTFSQDVGGVRCCPEQPSEIESLEVDVGPVASVQDGAIGLQFSSNTQYCNLRNLELNAAQNCLALDVAGTGIVCSDKITSNTPNVGSGTNGACARIAGNDHHFRGGFLIERIHHPAGIRFVGDARNVTIGPSYFSPENDDPFIDDQTGGSSSWVSEGGQCATAGAVIFKDASSYGTLLSGPDGITSGDHHVWGRVEKIKDGSGHNGGLHFVGARGSRTMSASFTAQPNVETYIAHANSITATLPSWLGLAGNRITFRAEPGKTGFVIKPATGQNLIDATGATTTGPATYAVPTAGVTLEPTDSGWMAVA